MQCALLQCAAGLTVGLPPDANRKLNLPRALAIGLQRFVIMLLLNLTQLNVKEGRNQSVTHWGINMGEGTKLCVIRA